LVGGIRDIVQTAWVKSIAILVAAVFVFGLGAMQARAQDPLLPPDVSLLVLTCDIATQAALKENVHVLWCRHYGQDYVSDWKAQISVTVKTDAGKFIVTVPYYKSPWWAGGIEVVRA
jgi:hypothetical protein